MTTDERPDGGPGVEPRPAVDPPPAADVAVPRDVVAGPAGPDAGATAAGGAPPAEATAAGEATGATAAPAADALTADPAPGAAETGVATPSDPPDADTLAAVATPATIRRAPKVSAFITAGAVLGIVVGWVLASVFTGTTGEARTAVVLVTTVAAGVLGGLVGGGLATVADRRSTRR